MTVAREPVIRWSNMKQRAVLLDVAQRASQHQLKLSPVEKVMTGLTDRVISITKEVDKLTSGERERLLKQIRT